MALIIIILLAGWGLYVMLDHPQENAGIHRTLSADFQSPDREALIRISSQ